MIKKIPPNIIVIFALLLLIGGGGTSLLSLSTSPGYTTGYEGVKARYVGVSYAGENHKGTLWGSTFSWDPDEAYSGMPDITGEMTSVFIPKESVGFQQAQLGGKDIKEWLLGTTEVRNPVKTYEWELTEGNTTKLYRMEEWELRWFFSISSDPDLPDEVEWTEWPLELFGRRSLFDVEVWFEFDLQPVWYFEGADHAYFAIAQARLAEDVALGGRWAKPRVLPEYSEDEINTELSVTPMSRQSILSIYYGLFGAEANRAEKEAYTYKGKKLNPDLFTDKVYAKVHLNDFGVSSWYDFGNFWRGDVATFAVAIRVFVVGEWTVQDIQELPEEYGRTAKLGGVSALGFLASPEARLLMLLIAGAFIFLILAIFAPWVLMAIMQIFGGRRR